MNIFLQKILFIVFIVVGTAVFSAQSTSQEKNYRSENSKNELVIFPNPAKDFVKLSSKNLLIKIKNVKIYSIIGVEVASFSVNQFQTELALEKLKSGKYLISFEMADGQLIVKQLVKM